MSRSRHHGRPPGDLEKITDSWKQRVREALDARAKSEQWLADQLAARLKRPGMKRYTVHKLLRQQKQSALVPHISAILEIDNESQIPDDVVRRAIELVVRQPPERLRALINFLETVSSGD